MEHSYELNAEIKEKEQMMHSKICDMNSKIVENVKSQNRDFRLEKPKETERMIIDFIYRMLQRISHFQLSLENEYDSTCKINMYNFQSYFEKNLHKNVHCMVDTIKADYMRIKRNLSQKIVNQLYKISPRVNK